MTESKDSKDLVLVGELTASNLTKEYEFIVQTNSYAGNFEREMCAYMTGVIGECEVGSRHANDFADDRGFAAQEKFYEYIENKPGDQDCYRPVEICGLKCNDFKIFFRLQPDVEMILCMKERAIEFALLLKDLEVLGFKMVEKTTIIDTTEIEI